MGTPFVLLHMNLLYILFLMDIPKPPCSFPTLTTYNKQFVGCTGVAYLYYESE